MPSNYNTYRNGLLPDFEEENLGFPYDEPSVEFFEDYDNSITDIDFSSLAGKPFNKAFKTANRKVTSKAIEKRSLKKARPIKGKRLEQPKARPQAGRPTMRKPIASKRPIQKPTRQIGVKRGAKINQAQKKISSISVPADKKVIIEGVNKFILSQKPNDDASYESMKARVMDQIERVFRPEFLNRLDDVIIFRHLNKEDLKKVKATISFPTVSKCTLRVEGLV